MRTYGGPKYSSRYYGMRAQSPVTALLPPCLSLHLRTLRMRCHGWLRFSTPGLGSLIYSRSEKVSNTCNKYYFLNGYVISPDGHSFQTQIYTCKTHDNAEVNYLLCPPHNLEMHYTVITKDFLRWILIIWYHRITLLWPCLCTCCTPTFM
jgi:hypothetical protein